jgi:predicted nucleic acid-binding protein
MSACFADTYFFIALLSENDAAHGEARARIANLSGPLYTSIWVLTGDHHFEQAGFNVLMR